LQQFKRRGRAFGASLPPEEGGGGVLKIGLQVGRHMMSPALLLPYLLPRLQKFKEALLGLQLPQEVCPKKRLAGGKAHDIPLSSSSLLVAQVAIC
jgi:hypothetical protein